MRRNMSANGGVPVVKNQHLVTEKYLRRWANKSGQVHVFDLRTGTTRQTNTTKVAAQRYFYSGPYGEQRIERALAVLEDFWIKAQDQLLAQAQQVGSRSGPGARVIVQSSKEQLADALVQQWVRTERVRRSFEHLGPEEAREAHAAFMTQPSVFGLARTLENGIWVLRRNDALHAAGPLYTSDHPVCDVPVDPDAALERYRVRYFTFPLSPAYLLMIFAPGTTQITEDWDGCVMTMEIEDVEASNVLQLNSAERIVLSSEEDFRWARRWFTQASDSARTGPT
jgi:Protein of unknown function (DUF4238)